MKFKIITFGCKVNAYESEMIKEKLIAEGYFEADKDIDVVIINTCSVTNTADAKCKRTIRNYRKSFPKAVLVVCGCCAENHRESLLELGIDILIGNKDKSFLPEIIRNYQETKEEYVKFYDNQNLEFEDMQVDKFSSKTRAFVKIQDGCNNYCAYCIIPYMRGNIRFKEFNKSVLEVKTLVNNNHKEIVFTGIHTGSYGRGTNKDLVDLINEVSKLENLNRIRISSIEITEISAKFLEMLKNNPKVCNHLHIPLQSGKAKILKLMNRKYDLNYFAETIRKIRNIRPDISITTDVIVGFPEETEEDFLETYKFCTEMKFAKIHVFPYSVRTGTPAALMPQIPGDIKKERARKLIKLSEKLEYEYYCRFIGLDLEVLIEDNKNNLSMGHTGNYLKVLLDSNEEHNSEVTATIQMVEDGYAKAIKKEFSKN